MSTREQGFPRGSCVRCDTVDGSKGRKHRAEAEKHCPKLTGAVSEKNSRLASAVSKLESQTETAGKKTRKESDKVWTFMRLSREFLRYIATFFFEPNHVFFLGSESLTKSSGMSKSPFWVCPGCANDARVSGNTSKLVSRPLTLFRHGQYHYFMQWIGRIWCTKKHWFGYFCVHLKNVAIW